ncbi:MAG: glycoside hydrolase family 43 protein [Ignavibacteria bacterium]|jgi:alpha-N-arabinofuranosidase
MKYFSLLGFLVIFIIVITGFKTQENKKFTNPVLAGFYPDPSICQVEDDYYLVTSTFSYFPGIPVFHSKDLVNWELMGHVLDRAEQLDTEGLGLSRGIFAPAISYHDGKFYVTCTVVDGGGNFVVTSEKPEGSYSNPVWLPEIMGIDPSLYFDDDGKTYILYNSDAPDNKPLYEGHRTIRMFDFDIETLKVVGQDTILINGGSDLSKKPIWIEGPHLYKMDGHYYLMAAEGGTAEDHSEVIFRSKNIYGPYESYKNNPILTQRHLDPKREFPITSTGHADLVSTKSGEWWAVFLGIRPYRPFEKNYYNLGRETFLAPVRWIEDSEGVSWPVINPDFDEVQYYYDYPDINTPKKENIIPYSGNFTTMYDFNNETLHKNFIYLRTPKEKWWEIKDGAVVMNLRPKTCSGTSNPSFLAHRQQHIKGSASTSVSFEPSAENEKAGLVIFLNESHYYFICKSLENGEPAVQLYKAVEEEDSDSIMELITSAVIDKEQADKKLNFKIETDSKTYSFYYAFENNKWISLEEGMDGTYLRAVIPRDFIGCVFAMYATSLGEESSSKAYFDWFKYTGDDEIYKNN